MSIAEAEKVVRKNKRREGETRSEQENMVVEK